MGFLLIRDSGVCVVGVLDTLEIDCTRRQAAGAAWGAVVAATGSRLPL
jgi:hypothetical protein